MRRTAVIAVALVLTAAASTALAEDYYWGEIDYGGIVRVDGYGTWGEVGYDRDDYYVYVDGFGDWIWITWEGDIWVDGRYWGYMNAWGEVHSETRGLLFTIEYDADYDEYFYDGVFAYDPQTVFFVLALEEKYFGYEVGLFDVLTFNQPPIADIETRTEGGIRTIAFDANAFDLDGTVENALWDFGDGTTSAELDPVHTYATTGRFLVTLTVWDDLGEPYTTTRRLNIRSRPPRARFGRKRVHSVPGEIRFRDKSKDRNGVVVAWHWDFGDGTTSDERFPVHVYEERGRYMVTLTVWDDDGESARKIRGVKIRFRRGI